MKIKLFLFLMPLIHSLKTSPKQLFSKHNIKTFLSRSSNDHYKQKSLAPLYKPKTMNQKNYVSQLNNPDTSIIIGVGPAGCGKTLFACITAVEQLKQNKINKIVLTRPIVPVEEEELGFLPGSIINKWIHGQDLYSIFSSNSINNKN